MLKVSLLIFAILGLLDPTYAAQHISLPINGGLTLESRLTQVDDKKTNSTITLRYPQIIGKKLSTNENNFNKLIKQFITDKFNTFKSAVKVNADSGNKLLHKNKFKNFVNTNYSSYYITPHGYQIISVLFNTQIMLHGSAHPEDKIDSLNYEIKSGKLLKLDDLFALHSEYLPVISKYCKNEIKNKIKSSAIFYEQLEAKPENYKYWSVKAAGILIHFPAGQILPRVYGQQQILVPFSVLKDIPLSSLTAPCAKQPLNCVAASN